MKCQYLKQKFQLIEESIKKVENANLNDARLSSMLSSYLVVFISGIYEDCIESLFVQRAAKNKDKELENLVKTLLHRSFRNPDFDKIRDLAGALDPKYKKELDSTIGKQSKDAINSIVDNKNKVAHGEASNATINDICLYHTSAIKIFDELEKILL